MKVMIMVRINDMHAIQRLKNYWIFQPYKKSIHHCLQQNNDYSSMKSRHFNKRGSENSSSLRSKYSFITLFISIESLPKQLLKISSDSISNRSQSKSVSKIKLQSNKNPQHSELHKYLRALKCQNKPNKIIGTGLINFRENRFTPLNVHNKSSDFNKSFDGSNASTLNSKKYDKQPNSVSSVDLKFNSAIEDDAYLIHPHKILGMSSPIIESPVKPEDHENKNTMSVSSLGLQREVSLKSNLK